MVFEDYLRQNLPKVESFHPHYQEALSKMLLAGGKRFRPSLIFSVVNGYAPELLENSFPVALAYEMLHTYSLIHDDLPAVDNSDLRRGHPTLHITFDEVTAILVGDALNTEAFSQIANASLRDDVKISLVKTLSENGGINGMVLGQAIDCHFENTLLSLEELEFLHKKKTGALIASSLEAGAIICDFSYEECKKIYDLGIKLGLLFQIQDDIIDATATKEEAGKPTGNDGEKNTFTNLLGVEGAIEKKSALIDNIKSELTSYNSGFQNNLILLIEKHLV